MTFVVAHRGSSGSCRENTLRAFSAAAREGAPWVELDVRASKDGVPIVVHDRPRPVAAAERPAWMPTLADALACCAEHGLGVIVEIKEVAIAPATDRLLRALDQEVLVSSFLPVALQGISAAPRALLVGDAMDPREAVPAARLLRCTALHPHVSTVDAALVRSCEDAGLGVMPWTVNERADLERMRDLGVTAVITDDVPLAREVLEG